MFRKQQNAKNWVIIMNYYNEWREKCWICQAGRRCWWAFALQQVDNWFHWALPAMKLSVQKTLQNPWLGKPTTQNQLAAKLYFPNWIPFGSKLIQFIGLISHDSKIRNLREGSKSCSILRELILLVCGEAEGSEELLHERIFLHSFF